MSEPYQCVYCGRRGRRGFESMVGGPPDFESDVLCAARKACRARRAAQDAPARRAARHARKEQPAR